MVVGLVGGRVLWYELCFDDLNGICDDCVVCFCNDRWLEVDECGVFWIFC